MNKADIDNIDKIFREIRLEALTATRNLKTEDPIVSSLTYISDVATNAISFIEQKT